MSCFFNYKMKITKKSAKKFREKADTIFAKIPPRFRNKTADRSRKTANPRLSCNQLPRSPPLTASYHVFVFTLSIYTFPKLGCGNGGLKWNDVRPLMKKYLDSLPIGIDIYIDDDDDF